MIQPTLSGDFDMPDANGEHALFFARSWAERLEDELPRALEAVQTFATKIRQAEYGEDWSPDDRELALAFRRMWTASSTLVWTAYQVERWTTRLAVEADEPVPEPLPHLLDLRNVLEHLDEAAFTDVGYAVVPETGRKGWSLRRLPEQKLAIASWQPGGAFFGLVDVDGIKRLSVALTARLERLLDELAEDYAVQEAIDNMRGK